MTDPKRWIDDPNLAESLRADLAHAIENPPAPPFAASFAKPVAPVVGLVGVVALLAVGGAIAWTAISQRSVAPAATSADESAQDNRVIEQAGEPTVVIPTTDEPESTLGENENEDIVIRDDTTVHMEQTSPSPTPAHSRSAEPATLADEIAAMARIRRSLERDPSAALALARRAQRTFDPGMFREERRAMIVLSLSRLQRPTAVRAARAFLQDYPSSTFVREIEEIADGGEGSRRSRQ